MINVYMYLWRVLLVMNVKLNSPVEKFTMWGKYHYKFDGFFFSLKAYKPGYCIDRQFLCYRVSEF